LNARKHSESFLALGNLTLEKSSSGKADFELLSCLTVRLAELSHIWAGILLTRTQKSTPGAFSPVSFSEQTALSSKSDEDRSLEIYSSTKGGLIKSIDDVKTSAKTIVMVPQDFYSFLYQLKAFTFAVGFVFSEDSILATKLLDFVEKVNKITVASASTERTSTRGSLISTASTWTFSCTASIWTFLPSSTSSWMM
jgi:hypothetical protein